MSRTLAQVRIGQAAVHDWKVSRLIFVYHGKRFLRSLAVANVPQVRFQHRPIETMGYFVQCFPSNKDLPCTKNESLRSFQPPLVLWIEQAYAEFTVFNSEDYRPQKLVDSPRVLVVRRDSHPICARKEGQPWH